jgi:hypothetical protein
MTGNPYRYLKACAWAGPAFLVITIVFWAFMGNNVPPPSPTLSATEFVARLRGHEYAFRFGMTMELFFSSLYLVWGLSITKVMQAVERDNDILSQLQLWGAGLTTLAFMIPSAMWTGISYRSSTVDPATLQMLFDMAWILFVVSAGTVTLQVIAMGICFLNDPRPVPLIPRWLSWFGIWCGLSFAILTTVPFFMEGPFSRSGTVNFWMEFGLFFVFMAAASFQVIRAIGRLEAEVRGAKVEVRGLAAHA